MNKLKNEIVVFGKSRSSDSWGPDYLPELRRILDQHVKQVTRAYLEWGAGNTTLAIIQWRDSLAIDRFFSIDDNADYLAELSHNFRSGVGFIPSAQISLDRPRMIVIRGSIIRHCRWP